MKLLEKLTQTPGVPGREDRVRELIIKETKGLFDEVRTDALGSLIGIRKPRPKKGKKAKKNPTKVMLAGHMDQIGFLVRHIDDKGFIRVQPVGGFDTRNLFARIVTVCTDDGDIPAVMNPGGKPIHIASEEDKKKIPDVGDFILDTGLSADDVKAKVKIGDMVVLKADFHRIGSSITSQCLDNRIACWVLIEAIKALKHHDCEIYAVWTVQEEVGCRGAGPAAYGLKPDVALSIDTTLCCDTPGVPDELRVTKMGEGAGIHMADSSMISDVSLIREIEAAAGKKKIKTQRCILPRGGNDAATILTAGPGYRVATLVCPVRYIHTVTETCAESDLNALRNLVTAYLESAG